MTNYHIGQAIKKLFVGCYFISYLICLLYWVCLVLHINLSVFHFPRIHLSYSDLTPSNIAVCWLQGRDSIRPKSGRAPLKCNFPLERCLSGNMMLKILNKKTIIEDLLQRPPFSRARKRWSTLSRHHLNESTRILPSGTDDDVSSTKCTDDGPNCENRIAQSINYNRNNRM